MLSSPYVHGLGLNRLPVFPLPCLNIFAQALLVLPLLPQQPKRDEQP